MDKIAMIEKLQIRADISYEEAKETLEKVNWDLLDAIVYLEKSGRIKEPSVSTYFTNENKEKSKEDFNEIIEYKSEKKESFSESFFETICRIIDKGNRILFIIKRNNKVLLKLPITVMILLVVFGFWGIIPLLIVGLFFEFEYSLEGYNMESSEFNKFLNKLSKYVQKIKTDFKRDNKND